jgi:hypothetical protein
MAHTSKVKGAREMVQGKRERLRVFYRAESRKNVSFPLISDKKKTIKTIAGCLKSSEK